MSFHAECFLSQGWTARVKQTFSSSHTGFFSRSAPLCGSLGGKHRDCLQPGFRRGVGGVGGWESCLQIACKNGQVLDKLHHFPGSMESNDVGLLGFKKGIVSFLMIPPDTGIWSSIWVRSYQGGVKYLTYGRIKIQKNIRRLENPYTKIKIIIIITFNWLILLIYSE